LLGSQLRGFLRLAGMPLIAVSRCRRYECAF
jgi:hypothetical protein